MTTLKGSASRDSAAPARRAREGERPADNRRFADEYGMNSKKKTDQRTLSFKKNTDLRTTKRRSLGVAVVVAHQPEV